MSNLDLARLPTQKLVPRGATAGVPFQPQPIVEFQDELNNPVDIEATVSVHFRQYDGELCEEDGEKQIIPEHASTGLSGTIQRGIEGNVPMQHHWNICYLSSLQSRRMVAGLV